MATTSSKQQQVPSALTTDVMTDQISQAIETRIEALEKHFGLGENTLGFVCGRVPQLGQVNGTMMTTQYLARIWIANGLVDIATVTAPSLEAAVNRAFVDATIVLPNYTQTTSARSAKVA